MKRRGVRLALAVLAAGAAVSPPYAVAATPPAGFVETLLVAGSDLSNPTALAYEPGTGDLWVLEKGGGGTARVRVRDADTAAVGTALTLDCVDSAGERGLLGIAFHPGYEAAGGASRYVYLFYTRDFDLSGCAEGQLNGSHNRVSRFTESGGQLVGEEVILEGEELVEPRTNHNGGTVRFAPDGTLFVSIGDNDSDAPGQEVFSRDLTDLRGKLLRIGDDGAIPADNPLAGAGGPVREEIWAYGLRNTFRFAIDPWTGTPYLGDVGESSWEALYAGIAGADYGYPCLEGSMPFRTCTPDPADADLTQPIFEYSATNQSPPVSGDSVTGGPVYRGTAFPEEYRGAYFFGDFVDGWIRRGRIGPDFQLEDVEIFLPDASGVVDMVVSPAGCLTWLSYFTDEAREVCPDPGLANLPPRAVATVDVIGGLAPLSVNFMGSSSTDPDLDPLLYEWNFGDGSATSSAADPGHTYAAAGVYQAQLTVDDQRMAANSEDAAPPLRIVVGNQPPTATIASPPAAGTYTAGQAIAFSGGGADAEDGALAADRLRWAVVFLRDGLSWPVQGPTTGIAAGSFTVPTTGIASSVGALRFYLTATDLGHGVPDSELADTTFVEIVPEQVDLTLAVDPAGEGLELALDGAAASAPISEASVVASERLLTAPTPQTVGATTWFFTSWSDGGAAEHAVATPAVDTLFTADYRCGLRVESQVSVDSPGLVLSGCDSWALGPDWEVTGTGGATVEALVSVELRNGVSVQAGGELTLVLLP